MAWSTRELLTMRSSASLGAEVVADQLGRTVHSVRSAARRAGVSLRRDGERRGRVFGAVDASGLQLSHAQTLMLRRLRDDVLAGRVDPVRMERRTRLIGHGAQLCPSCAVRPVEHERTGLCDDCRLLGLAEAHGLEAAAIRARRDLNKARSQKRRAKAE